MSQGSLSFAKLVMMSLAPEKSAEDGYESKKDLACLTAKHVRLRRIVFLSTVKVAKVHLMFLNFVSLLANHATRRAKLLRHVLIF